mgnify:CR=1 FL=1
MPVPTSGGGGDWVNCSEGVHYGIITSAKLEMNKTIKIGEPDERTGTMLKYYFKSMLPDPETGDTGAKASGVCFIFTESKWADKNYGYQLFLEAMGIGPQEYELPDGTKEKMLPDPIPEDYVGKKVRVVVAHRPWNDGSGNISADIREISAWDGVHPDTGEEVKIEGQDDSFNFGKNAEENNTPDMEDDDWGF